MFLRRFLAERGQQFLCIKPHNSAAVKILYCFYAKAVVVYSHGVVSKTEVFKRFQVLLYNEGVFYE